MDFYRRLGLTIVQISDGFARAELNGGACLEFSTAQLTRSYDPGWDPPSGEGSNTLNFELDSRDAVDDTYAALTEAGYRGHLAPAEQPWGARFALLDDPDGNVVGLHSPRDRSSEGRTPRA